MKIALDAMGGDRAPDVTIEGAAAALAEFPDIEKLFLVGDEAQLKQQVEKHSLPGQRVEIVHAPTVVDMHDPPTAALRGKKDSSITIAAGLVKSGDCEALVSAGNTGAAVAASSVKLRNLPGIRRSGICSPMPSAHGAVNILDAGANPDATSEDLVHYAVMGTVYARHVLGVDNPKVGLMSVGEEDHKGNELTKETFHLLKATHLNFKGNVEGHDLFESGIDVVVCDGFVGNVVLKTCEATAKYVMNMIKGEIKARPLAIAGAVLAKGAFKAVKQRGNPETYGGSPLLGVNGTCIIGHGSSSATAIKNALRVAAESVTHGVNPHIEEEIARLPS